MKLSLAWNLRGSREGGRNTGCRIVVFADPEFAPGGIREMLDDIVNRVHDDNKSIKTLHQTAMTTILLIQSSKHQTTEYHFTDKLHS